ncbi:hypothetical protein HK101_000723, partial [Irineochytrium annulatum]
MVSLSAAGAPLEAASGLVAGAPGTALAAVVAVVAGASELIADMMADDMGAGALGFGIAEELTPFE